MSSGRKYNGDVGPTKRPSVILATLGLNNTGPKWLSAQLYVKADRPIYLGIHVSITPVTYDVCFPRPGLIQSFCDSKFIYKEPIFIENLSK